MSSGIYAIRNRKNGKQYIGSAVSLEGRQRAHFRALRRGTHHNPHLQRAFILYGGNAFVFVLLEQVGNPEMLIQREQHYFDTLNPEYNIALIAGSTLGCRWNHSEETKLKMSKARVGKSLSKEHRAALSIALEGRRLSKEHRAALSAALKGRHLGKEHRQNLSAALVGNQNGLGYRFTEEQSQKLSERMMGNQNTLGYRFTEEQRQKRSEATKRRWVDPEYRQKMSETASGNQNSLGHRHTTETRRKMSIAQKKRRARERTQREV